MIVVGSSLNVMTSLVIGSWLGGCYYYNSENIVPMVVVWGVNGYVSRVRKSKNFLLLKHGWYCLVLRMLFLGKENFRSHPPKFSLSFVWSTQYHQQWRLTSNLLNATKDKNRRALGTILESPDQQTIQKGTNVLDNVLLFLGRVLQIQVR